MIHDYLTEIIMSSLFYRSLVNFLHFPNICEYSEEAESNNVSGMIFSTTNTRIVRCWYNAIALAWSAESYRC